MSASTSHVAGEDARERLPDLHAQVRIHVVERLAIWILLGNGWTIEPFVARGKLRSEARDGCPIALAARL